MSAAQRIDNRQSTTESVIDNRIDNRQPNRQSTTESTIDNRIDNRQPNRNSLSTGVVRVKNATTAVNNRVTRVRSLRIAEGTRSRKTHSFINRYIYSSIAAPIHQSLHPFINRCTHSSIAAHIHQSLHSSINCCTHSSIAAP